MYTFLPTVDQRYRIFFFPRKSLRVTHSLDFRSGTEKKKTSFFFFPAQNFQFLACFFFLRKSLHCTHSLKIRGRKKKTASEKKKQLFHSLTRNLSKSGEKQTFPGKKKIRFLCLYTERKIVILFFFFTGNFFYNNFGTYLRRDIFFLKT